MIKRINVYNHNEVTYHTLVEIFENNATNRIDWLGIKAGEIDDKFAFATKKMAEGEYKTVRNECLRIIIELNELIEFDENRKNWKIAKRLAEEDARGVENETV